MGTALVLTFVGLVGTLILASKFRSREDTGDPNVLTPDTSGDPPGGTQSPDDGPDGGDGGGD